jgi:type 1 fimbriae regulatory protein FimB
MDGILDKMMNRRKKRNTGATNLPVIALKSATEYDSDRLHLTAREVGRLLAAAKDSRNEIRDRCLVLITFRHGLRVSEACRLKLDQVDPESRVIHVVRLKRGLSTTHPLRLDALRAIGAWLKVRASMKVPANMKTFFVSGQRKPLHRSTVNLTNPARFERLWR